MRSQAESLLAGFAGPIEPIAPEILDALVCEYARGYTRVFLDRFRGDLRTASDGLVELLEEWLESVSTFETVWNWSASRIRTAVLSPSIEPLAAAAQFALHLNSRGLRRSWKAAFPRPAHIAWDRLRYPGTTQIDVSASHDDVVGRLRYGTDQQATMSLCHSSAPGNSTGIEESLRCLMDRNYVELLIDQDDDGPRSVDREHAICSLPPAAVLSAFSDAIALLRRHAPSYLEWVDRVIRQIAPVDGSDGILRSSSSKQWPGVIEVSFPSRPAATAEMLVHEASHQYLHILTRGMALHDPRDERLYYSPVKGRGRPIDMILLAFHAFANVVLFYRACVESGLEDGGYCQRGLERHYAELEVMRGHLQSSNSLTETGALMWETLADRVFSRVHAEARSGSA